VEIEACQRLTSPGSARSTEANGLARSAGWECFVTSARFLDEVAHVLKLPVVVVNDTVDFDTD
jgi:hypothetical protein